MSVNTPASWSVRALSKRLGMLSGKAALRGLTLLNVLLTSATENESSQSYGVAVAHVGGTVFSSKLSKKVFSLFGIKTSVSATCLNR